MTNENPTTRFDAALRGHHAAALQQMSPRVRAQLAQRRHAALRGTAAARGHRMGYAVAGFAALCALAIGLQFRSPPSTVTPAAVAASTALPLRIETTTLDQDPDFYAWLASSDALQVAME